MFRYKNIVFFLLVLAVWWRGLFFCAGITRIHVSGDESIMALQAVGITQKADSPLFQTKQHPPGLAGRFPLLFMAQPYLFPFESYLCAPFIRFLPTNAFGVRFIPALMGLCSCFLGMLLIRRFGLKECIWQHTGQEDIDKHLLKGHWKRVLNRWCGLRHKGINKNGPIGVIPLLLLVFPAAYVLQLQSVYMLPSYPGFMLLTVAAFYCAVKDRALKWTNPVWAFFAGICAGLASSNSLMALPLTASLAVMCFAGGRWRKAVVSGPACVVGAAVGLLPYYMACRMYPGANDAVSALVPFRQALSRIWSPALNFTLPTALGFRATLVPDTLETVGLIPDGALPLVAVVWFAFMVAATVVALVGFARRSIQQRWPDIWFTDVMTGLSWVYLLLFVMSTRFGSHEFRYLLPVVFFFPFVFARLYFAAKTVARRILGAAAIVLVLFNLATSLLLLRAWYDDSFNGYFTDTRPAIDYMRDRGINRCYSSYFDAYTINYLSGESIVCAQPFNERFFGWPYPYVDLVDRATNVAYVLGPGRRFRREDFERDMRENDIAYKKTECGQCSVYTDFVLADKAQGIPLSAEDITVEVSHHADDAETLADGILTHQWRSHTAQQTGMWIRVHLPESLPLEKVRFYYNGYPHDHAVSIAVSAYDDGEWHTVMPSVPFELAGFDFVNDHPVYGFQVQDIALDGLTTDALEISILEANPGRDWTIGEIEVYCVDDGGGEQG